MTIQGSAGRYGRPAIGVVPSVGILALAAAAAEAAVTAIEFSQG